MLVNNKHPLVPMSTLRAGYRLVLHGLATETLHAMLVQFKRATGCASGVIVLADETLEAATRAERHQGLRPETAGTVSSSLTPYSAGHSPTAGA